MQDISPRTTKPRVRMYPAHRVGIRNGRAVRIPQPPPVEVDVIGVIERAVALAAPERCPHCKGLGVRGWSPSGHANDPHARTFTCSECRGTGEIA